MALVWCHVSAPTLPFNLKINTNTTIQALAPYITQSIGIDVSEGMVSEYNKSAENQGVLASEMHAHIGNLLNPADANPASLSSQEFFNFDIAAVGLGFHHFDDPTLAAKRLAERLKTGGALFIVDFLPHGQLHAGHKAKDTVKHLGFAEEEVRRMFTEAGVGGGFEYVVVGKGIVFTHEGQQMRRSLFMARGTKGECVISSLH